MDTARVRLNNKWRNRVLFKALGEEEPALSMKDAKEMEVRWIVQSSEAFYCVR